MKKFDYATALNQLKISKNNGRTIKYDLIPAWVGGQDFLENFLPYLKIIGDSREQDKWIETACQYYGIAFEWAKHCKKQGSENLKEGDYTFMVEFDNKKYDYTGRVAFERKGSLSELFNNCTGYDRVRKTSDRDRIGRELDRTVEKQYDKVVLMLEFGETLTDLINATFSYISHNGRRETKSVDKTVYSTIMSWKQPNNKDFDIIQSKSHEKLFWLFIQECYYYFRNEIKLECLRSGILES